MDVFSQMSIPMMVCNVPSHEMFNARCIQPEGSILSMMNVFLCSVLTIVLLNDEAEVMHCKCLIHLMQNCGDIYL